MRIYLGGGEKGSHRNLLLANSVQRIGINLTHLAIPKTKEFHIPTVYNGAEVLLYTSEGDEDKGRYGDFVREYADDLDIIIGRPDFDGEFLGDKYVPIWADGDDLERLAWLCQRYGRAAISDKAINTKTLPRIRSLSQRWDAKLVGLTSKPDIIEALPWDAIVVTSWTSAIRYGETQVWDGHTLRRYPAQQKESSRKRHRADIMRLGVDFEEIMEDNVAAVGTLAIKSWQQWESRTFGAYDPQGEGDEDEFSTSEGGDVVDISPYLPVQETQDSKGANIAIEPLRKRHESERILLPVIGVENIITGGAKSTDDQGEYIEIAPETIPVLRYNSSPLRQCDNCYLASRCPAFSEHSECGFKLPVEIRTKDQMMAAIMALIEMQVSRVFFARFAEELEGQGMDPALSSEMDRVLNMIDKFKNISDTRDILRMEIEAKGNAGVLSRLFGSKVGEQARALPGGPIESDRLLEIIDLDE